MLGTTLTSARSITATVQPCCRRQRMVRVRPAAAARLAPPNVKQGTHPEQLVSPSGGSGLRTSTEAREPYLLKPVQCEPHDRERPYTILAIDGGGMRGMIPACVLEQVEEIIKEEALKLMKKSCKDGSRLEDFTEVLTLIDGKEKVPDKQLKDLAQDLHVKSLKVDLADFFDLISGTSTGAILASYLATKGGASGPALLDPADKDKKERYRGPIQLFKEKHDADMFNPKGPNQEAELRPGSAVVAQALFAATGSQIFTKPWWNFGLLSSTYSQDGIDSLLKNVLCTSKNKEIMLSHSNELHSSLLIPSFQIEHNRPVIFWHLHQPDGDQPDKRHPTEEQPTREADVPRGSSFGYSTINRLRPFNVKELEAKTIDSTAIINNIAIAMSSQLEQQQSKKWTPAAVMDACSFEACCSDEPFVDKVTQKVLRLNWRTPLAEVEADDIKKVITGATQLLSAVQKGNRWAKQYLKKQTIEGALEAMIKPGLRPDMQTTMYVFTKPDAPPEPLRPVDARLQPRPLDPDKDPLSDPRIEPRRLLVNIIRAPWGLPTLLGGGTYAAGSDDWSSGAVQGPAPARLQLPKLPWKLQWPSWIGKSSNTEQQDGEPQAESIRFYEAQSGDSLHMYNVDFKLWEIVRASTAAPTYFPAAEVTSQGLAGIGETPRRIAFGNKQQPLLQGHFADGGVVANNPTLAAIAFMERAYGVEHNNIAVMSLGCGSVVDGINIEPNAGIAWWGLPLVNKVFMGSSIDTATALAEMVFTVSSTPSPAKASRYLRIQAVGFNRVAPPGNDGTLALQIQVPAATTDINKVRMDVNYLAIDPTAARQVSGLYTNTDLYKALKHMDRPEDWDKLRAVGTALGHHFKEDIRAWVLHHIIAPAPAV